MIAYYNLSAYVTLIIDEIIHDTEDTIVFHYVDNETKNKIGRTSRSRVRYSRKGEPFFYIQNKMKIYLDECMRFLV